MEPWKEKCHKLSLIDTSVSKLYDTRYACTGPGMHCIVYWIGVWPQGSNMTLIWYCYLSGSGHGQGSLRKCVQDTSEKIQNHQLYSIPSHGSSYSSCFGECFYVIRCLISNISFYLFVSLNLEFCTIPISQFKKLSN